MHIGSIVVLFRTMKNQPAVQFRYQTLSTIEKVFQYFAFLLIGIIAIFLFREFAESGQKILEDQIRYEMKFGHPLPWCQATKSIDLY